MIVMILPSPDAREGSPHSRIRRGYRWGSRTSEGCRVTRVIEEGADWLIAVFPRVIHVRVAAIKVFIPHTALLAYDSSTDMATHPEVPPAPVQAPAVAAAFLADSTPLSGVVTRIQSEWLGDNVTDFRRYGASVTTSSQFPGPWTP